MFWCYWHNPRTTLLLWTQFLEQKLQPCLTLKKFQNPFCHKFETLNKKYQKNGSGCHNLLLIYDAPKLSTVNVVKSSVLGFRGLFSGKLWFFSKVGIFQNPCCHILETLNKNFQKKIDTLLIYGAPKFSTVYLVKWPVLSLQRAPENLVLAPSVLVLYAQSYTPFSATVQRYN